MSNQFNLFIFFYPFLCVLSISWRKRLKSKGTTLALSPWKTQQTYRSNVPTVPTNSVNTKTSRKTQIPQSLSCLSLLHQLVAITNPYQFSTSTTLPLLWAAHPPPNISSHYQSQHFHHKTDRNDLWNSGEFSILEMLRQEQPSRVLGKVSPANVPRRLSEKLASRYI